jgi:hypothetical protein
MTAACLLPDVLDGSKRSTTAVCLCFATTTGTKLVQLIVIVIVIPVDR